MKTRPLLLALLVLTLLTPPVLGQARVSISPSNQESYAGTTQTYIATIYNDQTRQDRFLLSYTGTYPAWADIEKNNVIIAANANENVKITLKPPIGASQGVYRYIVKAESFSNASVIASNELFLSILLKYPVIIQSFALDSNAYNPGTAVNVLTSIKNLAETQDSYTLDVSITSPTGEKKGQSVPVSLNAAELKAVKTPVQLDKYQASGAYRANIELKTSAGEIILLNQTTFMVNSVINVPHTKTETKGWTAKDVSITVKNEGNVVANDIVIEEPVSNLVAWLITFDTQPQKTAQGAEGLVYSWTIASLNPGESKAINYRITYIPVIVLAALLFVGAVAFVIYMQQPRIRKRILQAGPASIGRVFTVVIDVKNASRQTMKSVIVRDWVPPVCQLVRHFGETVKPAVKKVEQGTEIVWKLGDMKPQEERVVTYKLSPVIGVSGMMNLPRAYIKFKDDVGNIMKIFSGYSLIGEREMKKEEE